MYLRRNSIIHCDLKPENILLVSASHPLIKVIDFGSACYENHTSFSYIQSRFYRSPEILVGLPYTPDIDMWSLGCITAELYLGLPLFAGTSELNQLQLITHCLGPVPSHMLLAGAKTRKYYNVDELSHVLKSEDQFCTENNTLKKKPNRKYFDFNSLAELTAKYPLSGSDALTRQMLAHLLAGLLQLDPLLRWTPLQASRHPFVTGDPFDTAWRPPRRHMGALFEEELSPAPSPRTAVRGTGRPWGPVGESPPRRTARSGSLPFPEMVKEFPEAPEMPVKDLSDTEDSGEEWDLVSGFSQTSLKPAKAWLYEPPAAPVSRARAVPGGRQGRKKSGPDLGMTPTDGSAPRSRK
jgi:serine/threonine protein kinase